MPAPWCAATRGGDCEGPMSCLGPWRPGDARHCAGFAHAWHAMHISCHSPLFLALSTCLAVRRIHMKVTARPLNGNAGRGRPGGDAAWTFNWVSRAAGRPTVEGAILLAAISFSCHPVGSGHLGHSASVDAGRKAWMDGCSLCRALPWPFDALLQSRCPAGPRSCAAPKASATHQTFHSGPP